MFRRLFTPVSFFGLVLSDFRPSRFLIPVALAALTACSEQPEILETAATGASPEQAVVPTPAEQMPTEYWPQWRGPNFDGTAPPSASPPTRWSETENVRWKTPLPSWSGSTPIVWGDRIFLTSPINDAPGELRGRPSGPGGSAIALLALDRAAGEILWQRVLGRKNELQLKHNMASPSPATDGQWVWAMSGTGDLAAFDFEGAEQWRRNLQDDYGPFGQNWGYGASPLLFRDRLIVPVLHGMKTDEPSYLAAIDKTTGKTLWRVTRPTQARAESPDAYTTPLPIEIDGKVQIIVTGGDVVTAHDPAGGMELWRTAGLNPNNSRNYRLVASPVYADGIVYAPSRNEPLIAVRAVGKDASAEPEVLWTARGPDVPSPVTDGERLYTVDDKGIARIYDAKTGEMLDEGRITPGTYSASLVLADGKIYATNETTMTTVLKAGPKIEVLAENRLEDPYTLSSPVVAGSQIFIRGAEHLYCIEATEGS